MPPKSSKLEVSRSIQMSYGRALGNARFPVVFSRSGVNEKTERSGNSRSHWAQWRHNLGRTLTRILQLAVGAWQIIGLFVSGPALIALGSQSLAWGIWVAFCCLAGVALSIWGPVFVAKKLRK